MCTAITYKTNDFYFGRTLDFDINFGQLAVITPAGFHFNRRNGEPFKTDMAILGMARIENGYPLYFDAVNKAGLCMAALNFVGNAKYNQALQNKCNIAQFEFIPWILGKCKTVADAKQQLSDINITNTPFSPQLPIAQLHWIIADKDSAITVECVADGMKIYDNPVGVLTNNPTFDIQLFSLNYLLRLSPENRLNDKINLRPYSLGMGALGLPGDLSSQSRFLRAAFTKLHSVSECDEKASVGQFFHILGTVSQTKGCCITERDGFEYTQYTSCYNTEKGILYYTTYNNRQISAINLNRANLTSPQLIIFPLSDTQQINLQN